MARKTRHSEAFTELIEADGFLTEADRRMLTDLLFTHFYDITYPSLDKLAQSDFPERFPNWYQLFRHLLEVDRVRDITKNQEEFSVAITKETLRWAQRMHLRFRATHDFQREEATIQHLRQRLETAPHKAWLEHLDELLQLYPANGSNWRFYRRALQREVDNGSARSANTRVLRENILNDWKRYLSEAQESQLQEFLTQAWEEYFGELDEKVRRLEELEDLIEPVSQFLGQSWTESLGNWSQIDWSQIEAMARQLRDDVQLQALIEWLGRWQANQKAMTQRQLRDPKPKQHWQPNPYGRSEIVGIHHSNQLESTLPTEFSLLSAEETEWLFSLKYLEHKLLSFQYRSLDAQRDPDPRREETFPSATEDRGPFILCIDTSGSMYGHPEHIAKALALATLQFALQQKRRVFLISFSSGHKSRELTGVERSLEPMVEFLNMSFHGSTDIHPALRETLRLLNTEAYEKADVLVISDFQIPRLDRELLDELQQAKKQLETEFHSLYIARSPAPSHIPLPIFEHHWVYDLDHPKVMRQWIDHFDQLRPSVRPQP